MLSKLSSLLFGASRKTRRARVSKRRVFMEPLEDRRLLAVVWANRGDDDFGTHFGANATAAREIVDHAIDDWNAIITDFNYQNVGTPGNAPTDDLQVEIRAADLAGLGAGVLGATDEREFDAEGKPYTARIRIDDNAAGTNWFYDTSPENDSEYSTVVNAFAASATGGGAGTMLDFSTNITHELGHAVGIVGVHIGNSNDLMNANQPAGQRRLVSDVDRTYLAGLYTYTMATPSQVDTMYVNQNGSTAEVRGTNGADTVTLTASSVQVNGTQEAVTGNAFTVSTGGGNDVVNTSSSTQYLNSVSIDFGSGSDRLVYTADASSSYETNVSGTGISELYRFVGPSPYVGTSFTGAEFLDVNGTSGTDFIRVNSLSGVGNTTVNSQGGNDYVYASPSGQYLTYVTYDLGSGSYDRLYYTAAVGPSYGVSISGNSISVPYLFVGPSPYIPAPFSGAERMYVYGGSADDTMTFGANTGVTYAYLYGYGGNDIIDGRGSNTTLIVYGSTGNDTIYGGNLRDYLYGQDGNDTIYGEGGNDYIRAGNGNDDVFGGLGNDTIYGEDGNDDLVGNAGSDTIYGGNGDDWIFGEDWWTWSDPSDQLFGEAGYDYVFHDGWLEVG